MVTVACPDSMLADPTTVEFRWFMFDAVLEGARRMGEASGLDASEFALLVGSIRDRGEGFGRVALPRLTKTDRRSALRIDVEYQVEETATRAVAVIHVANGTELRREVIYETTGAWNASVVLDARSVIVEGDTVIYRDADRRTLGRVAFK